MKLFSITVSAWRPKEDGQPEVVMQNVVGLMTGDVDIIQASLDHAHSIFPEAEEWKEHQVVWTEIEQGMPFGPYRLVWRANLAPENEGVEQ